MVANKKRQISKRKMKRDVLTLYDSMSSSPVIGHFPISDIIRYGQNSS